jgi:hypothetical protein
MTRILKILYKFLKLPFSFKVIVLETIFWMVLIQVALRLSNYKRTEKIFSHFLRLERVSKSNINSSTCYKISWAIEAVGKNLPGLSCLRNAMTAKVMFANRRCPVEIRIGITKKAGEIKGHAWVEKDGVVIVGGNISPASYILISTNQKLFDKLCADMR